MTTEEIHALLVSVEGTRSEETTKDYDQGWNDALDGIYEKLMSGTTDEEPTEQEQPPSWQTTCSFAEFVSAINDTIGKPPLQKGKDGMLYPCPMPVQQEPSPLEVALRLIESGKCPAIPTQSRDMAFNLITCIRAEEARRAGR